MLFLRALGTMFFRCVKTVESVNLRKVVSAW